MIRNVFVCVCVCVRVLAIQSSHGDRQTYQRTCPAKHVAVAWGVNVTPVLLQ